MGGPRGSVVAVLRDPPKKVPRSPILVRAKITERSRLESEDAVPPVEVRWRVPSQASLAPAVCGDVERYYVKCFCRGKGKEVLRIPPLVVDVPCTRRDFCRNQVRALISRMPFRNSLSQPIWVECAPLVPSCLDASASAQGRWLIHVYSSCWNGGQHCFPLAKIVLVWDWSIMDTPVNTAVIEASISR